MAVPTPWEVFLAIGSGARLCLPKGLEGQACGPLVWQLAGDHLQTAGGTDCQFLDQQLHRQIRGLPIFTNY